MADLDYLQKISSVLKKEYTGEPEGLSAFIEQIELLELGTTEANKQTLVKFIKCKLVGRASD